MVIMCADMGPGLLFRLLCIVQNHGQIEISHENLVKCRDLRCDRRGWLHFIGISDKINWLYYSICIA